MKANTLILIGMPGCGKSTIGVLTAKVLGLSFLDTDLLLQEREGKLLQDIIDKEGLESFRQKEEAALLSVQGDGILIATGGSAIYYPSAMEHLSRLGKIVYLRSTLERIKIHLRDFSRRGITIPCGMSIDALFAERKPLYEKYANLILDIETDDISENMNRLVALLHDAGLFPDFHQ